MERKVLMEVSDEEYRFLTGHLSEEELLDFFLSHINFHSNINGEEYFNLNYLEENKERIKNITYTYKTNNYEIIIYKSVDIDKMLEDCKKYMIVK